MTSTTTTATTGEQGMPSAEISENEISKTADLVEMSQDLDEKLNENSEPEVTYDIEFDSQTWK